MARAKRIATYEQAAEWAYLEGEDRECVAGTILDWLTGYRCEKIYVPMAIRRWAYQTAQELGMDAITEAEADKYGCR